MKLGSLSVEQLDFISEIKTKVREAQYSALKAVNVELLHLYWEIGKSITEKQTQSWGKAVVPTLSAELQREFPGVGGFSTTNLWLMAQFYAEYHTDENLQPLVGEISWTKHTVILNKCKDSLERQFYILSTKKFGWTCLTKLVIKLMKSIYSTKPILTAHCLKQLKTRHTLQ